MEFLDIINQANNNVKKSIHQLGEVESELQKEKRKETEKLLQLKLERKRKEEMKKQGEFASRNKGYGAPGGKGPDASNIQKFLQNKEKERLAKLKREQEKKENLLEMRLKANGGKANKKIAKHFGADALDLQIKYGTDRKHIETLVKQKEREELEAERLASHYRNGVQKAFEQRKKLDETGKLLAKNDQTKSRTKHSLLNVEADGFNKMSKSNSQTSQPVLTQKKRPADGPLDFSSLMQTAEKMVKREKIVETIEREKPTRKSTAASSYAAQRAAAFSNAARNSDRVGQLTPLTPSSSRVESKSRPEALRKTSLVSTQSQLKSAPYKPNGLNKPEEEKGFTVQAEALQKIPVDSRGKRILPGDLRYKEMVAAGQIRAAPVQQPAPTTKTALSSSTKVAIEERASKQIRSQKEEEKRSGGGEERRKAEERRRREIMKRRLETKRREEEERRRREHARGKQASSSRNYEEEDEMGDSEEDSEMDDFIDDSGLEMNDMSRKDLEEAFSIINKNYNKDKWRQREKMISERDMVSDYRTIAREEARSARLGMMEDLREAVKGKSERL